MKFFEIRVIGVHLLAFVVVTPVLIVLALLGRFWSWCRCQRRAVKYNHVQEPISYEHIAIQERGDSPETRILRILVPVAAFFAFSASAEARYLHPGEPSRPMPPALNAFLLVVAAIGVGLLLWAFWSCVRDELEVRRQARALERFRRVNGKKCHDGGRG